MPGSREGLAAEPWSHYHIEDCWWIATGGTGVHMGKLGWHVTDRGGLLSLCESRRFPFWIVHIINCLFITDIVGRSVDNFWHECGDA